MGSAPALQLFCFKSSGSLPFAEFVALNRQRFVLRNFPPRPSWSNIHAVSMGGACIVQAGFWVAAISGKRDSRPVLSACAPTTPRRRAAMCYPWPWQPCQSLAVRAKPGCGSIAFQNRGGDGDIVAHVYVASVSETASQRRIDAQQCISVFQKHVRFTTTSAKPHSTAVGLCGGCVHMSVCPYGKVTCRALSLGGIRPPR